MCVCVCVCVCVCAHYKVWTSQVTPVVKNLLANAGNLRDVGLHPWVGKIPLRMPQQHAPVFLPGESHGQRILVATVHVVAKSQI